ncbi:MAG: cysteine desulfurase [Flammeovirgaceae bacterium]|nr:cysteine desulfurase [Flammeovirgaceae bacterium]HCX24825.1 cysteine desulfurase [Cytophagales bacterium]|tara:strand:- start:4452 stop:5903 length:1452 start_codon:yes stop_codon:yes gene_type:complete
MEWSGQRSLHFLLLLVMKAPLDSLSTFNQFIENRYPGLEDTKELDTLRASDYCRLDEQKHTYLDFTGGNLYGTSQIEQHHQLLKESILGNPHSLNPSSLRSSELVDQARKHLLEFFNATDDYFLIFTPNASGALKIIGESYPFHRKSHFLLPFDNHNSVNGIREYAKHNGASYSYSPLNYEDLRFNEEQLLQNLQGHQDKTNKLFAYPAQSNVSGVQHSLKWVKIAQDYGWDVLLDASAFVPTNQLDLSNVKPEFVSMSFYKMFGYPTGMGGLLIRKDAFKKLTKPWFAGGTVTLASAMTDRFYLAEDHSKFEDGTINYLDIPALEIGIRHLENVGMDTIHRRVSILTKILLEQLQAMKHPNGQPMIKLFGPTNTEARGGTIIFNFLTSEGETFPYLNVEKEANKRNISLRTGCFCNPGIDEINNHLETGELENFFQSSENTNLHDITQHLDTMRGAVRISVGLITNIKDIYNLLTFVKDFSH